MALLHMDVIHISYARHLFPFHRFICKYLCVWSAYLMNSETGFHGYLSHKDAFYRIQKNDSPKQLFSILHDDVSVFSLQVHPLNVQIATRDYGTSTGTTLLTVSVSCVLFFLIDSIISGLVRNVNVQK